MAGTLIWKLQVLNYLEANRAQQAYLAPVDPYATLINGAYTVNAGVDYYAVLQAAIKQNYLPTMGLIDVSTNLAEVTGTKMGLYGAGNKSTRRHCCEVWTIKTSFLMTTDTGALETHYVFAPGAFGLYYWLSPNAAQNEIQVPDKDYWYTVKDPMFDYFDAGVHYQSNCTDTAGLTSGTTEPVYYDKWEVTVDWGLVKAYTSVTGESPIVKFNALGGAGI